MNLLRKLFGGAAVSDERFLQADPISRKRMDLAWLDPPRLSQLKKPLDQHGVVTVVIGDSSCLREHEITLEDFEWAKQVEQVVDKAFSAGQRGNCAEAIRYYKEALELAPGCDLFLMSIGAAYAQSRRKERALRYLERAAQVSPGNARIRENLENARRL